MTKDFSLQIDGMTCSGCVRRVTTALEAIDGVDVATVAVGTASGSFDEDDVVLQDVVTAVEQLGFKVIESGASGPANPRTGT